jgi:class 3 adenylate cyclase
MFSKRILTAFVAFTLCTLSYAQQDKMTDSLELVLKTAKDDTAKVNNLITLSKIHIGFAPDTALNYANGAYALASSLKYVKGQAYALKYIGNYYYNQGKEIETLDNWLRSLELFKSINDKLGISNTMSNIGALYNNKADYGKALEYLLPGLTIAEELGDKLRIATLLINIAESYKSNERKALENLLRALSISEELQNQGVQILVNTNIGEIYLGLNKIDSSLFYFNKGLKAIKNDKMIEANFILNDIGKAYAKKGDFSKAIQFQQQSIDLAKYLKATLYIGKSQQGLGDTYLQKGDIDLAIQMYDQAEPLLKETNAFDELKDTYNGLSTAYSKKGDFSKAFSYLTQVVSLKDKLSSIDQAKKVSSLQLEYDISRKQLSINELTKNEALKELDLQKQKATRNIFAIGFGLILVIVFVLYRNYRQKVKTNILLDKQKAQIETLMLNILPGEVADELKEQGHATPRHYESASVLFTDYKGFTKLADKMTPQELIEELNDSFIAFDDIIVKYNLEKIKTIGDSYMCAGGIPTPFDDYAINMVKAGLEIQAFMNEKNRRRAENGLAPWDVRVGIHVGPIVAGVVGKKKYAYDIWGNTVNIASRMESSGEAGKVNISESTYLLVKDHFKCVARGKIAAKNVGDIDMYFVEG